MAGVTAPTDLRDRSDDADQPALDAALAEAVELARAAAVELAATDVGVVEAGSPSHQVGRHLGVRAEGEYAVTHGFACALPGYVGWHWAVTLVRAPGDEPGVAEVVLLPGEGALLAPAWVPWSERLRPGDLSPGDLLPTAPDDPRLVPGYTDSGDPQVEEVAFELGLGRIRVLSREGRLQAADRWQEGDFGPDSPMAKQAPAPCGTCGFFVALGGSLRAGFGVCANEFAAADGRVVAVEYGCGAHSEVEPEPPAEPAEPAYEDELIDVLDLGSAAETGSEAAIESAEAGSAKAGSAEVGSAEPVAELADQAVIDIEPDTVDPVDGDQFAEAGEGEQDAATATGELAGVGADTEGVDDVVPAEPAQFHPPAPVAGGVEEAPAGDAGQDG